MRFLGKTRAGVQGGSLMLLLLLGVAWQAPQVAASAFGVHFPHMNICKMTNICKARYILYSTCTPTHFDLQPSGLSSAANFTLHATLELNSTRESYEGHYDFVYDEDARKVQWSDGTTRINVTVKQDGGENLWCADGGCNVKAKVYTGTCSDPGSLLTYQLPPKHDFGDPMGWEDSPGPATPPPPGKEDWVLQLQANKSLLLGSMEANGKMDYDDVGSVMVELDGAAEPLCCNLVPQLPTLPVDFTAVIEANFQKPGRGESYTLHRKEYYSTARNAERLDEHSHKRTSVEIRDYAADKHYTVFKNATFPQGICQERTLSAWEKHLNGGNGFLQSTASFLSFSNKAMMIDQTETYEETYHGADHSVRGVKCEKWTHPMSFEMPFGPGTAAVTNQYTISHYFAETDWRERDEGYHRLPKRVLLNGTRADGTPVMHYYDFIDMMPFIEDADMVFDPCRVLGNDFLGNCTCPTKLLCVEVDTTSPNPEPSGIHPVEPEGVTALDHLCRKYGSRRGLAPGLVALVAFSMLFVGLLGALGIICYMRRMRNRKAMAHRHFDDMHSMELESMPS